MVNVTIELDEEIYEILKLRAQLEGTTLESLLNDMLLSTLEDIRTRMNDPLIGALGPFLKDDVEQDISSRADDILRDEWEPD